MAAAALAALIATTQGATREAFVHDAATTAIRMARGFVGCEGLAAEEVAEAFLVQAWRFAREMPR